MLRQWQTSHDRLVKDSLADVSSVTPSSEQIKELWVLRFFNRRRTHEKYKNKLVEWKVFVDTAGIKSANLKINFRS